MRQFLCRVMTLVFVANCLLPTESWGQTRRNSKSQTMGAQVERRVNRAASHAKTPADLFAQAVEAIEKLHTSQNADLKNVDWDALRANVEQAAATAGMDSVVIDGAAYLRQYIQANPQASKNGLQTKSQRLLEKVSKNEVDLEGLIAYVDPLDSTYTDNKTIAYAAEVIGNTVAGFTSNPLTAEERASLEQILPALEAHIVHSLEQFGYPAAWRTGQERADIKARQAGQRWVRPQGNLQAPLQIATKTPQYLHELEAISSLRIALLRIGTYYQTRKKADPLEAYTDREMWKRTNTLQARQARASVQQAHAQDEQLQRAGLLPGKYVEPTDNLSVNTLARHLEMQQPIRRPTKTRAAQAHNKSTAIRPTLTLASAPKQAAPAAPRPEPKYAAKPLTEYHTLAQFSDEFYREVRSLKEKNPQVGSIDFQRLGLLTEYATTYALNYDLASVEKLVRLFDGGVKKAADHVTILPGEYKHEYAPILNAIMVSLFENTRYSDMDDAQTQQVLALLTKFSDRTRYSLTTNIYALEAASLLYRPFREDTLSSLQDYAKQQLDSLQGYLHSSPVQLGKQTFEKKYFPINMSQPNEKIRRTLAMRTAALYCPIQSHHPGWKYETYGLSAQEMQKLADKLAYIYDGFYAIPMLPVHMQDNNPRPDYSECNIWMSNPVHKRQVRKETQEQILDFTWEAILWASVVADGFALLGTAFRLTRGAVAVLPRAATWAEVQDAARFANFVGKGIKQQGYRIEFLVKQKAAPIAKAEAKVKEITLSSGQELTVHTPKSADIVKAEAGTGAQTTEYTLGQTTWQPVNHTYQLRGQYGHWDWRRYIKGPSRNEEIVGMRVIHTKPGFERTVGTAAFETPIDGLHSIQDISRAWRQLRLPNGEPMYYENTPYLEGLLNTYKVQTEESLLGTMEGSFAKTFDTYTQLDNGKWWNAAQWGRPEGFTLRLDAPIFVAPKSARFSPRLGLMQKDGVADIPQLLPGFYTTAADVASGEVHRQAFLQFFRPLQHQNWVSKILMPDYVPTHKLWQVVKVNPLIGARFLPRLFLRSRTLWSAVGLAGFMGVDWAAYYPYESWVSSEKSKEMEDEMAQYGNTFTLEEEKKSEQVEQEILGDFLEKELKMTVYDDMLKAVPEDHGGTIMIAPIVMIRRAFGMPLIEEAAKADLAHQAYQKNLDRAWFKQQLLQQAQLKEKTDQEVLEQDELNLLDKYGVWFYLAPGTDEKIHQLFTEHKQALRAAKTPKEKDKEDERFVEKINQLLKPLDQKIKVENKKYQEEFHAKLVKMEAQAYVDHADVLENDPQLRAKVHRVFQTYEREHFAAKDWTEFGRADEKFEDNFYALVDKDFAKRKAKAYDKMSGELLEMRSKLYRKYKKVFTAERMERLNQIYQTAYKEEAEAMTLKNRKVRNQRYEKIGWKRGRAVIELEKELMAAMKVAKTQQWFLEEFGENMDPDLKMKRNDTWREVRAELASAQADFGKKYDRVMTLNDVLRINRIFEEAYGEMVDVMTIKNTKKRQKREAEIKLKKMEALWQLEDELEAKLKALYPAEAADDAEAETVAPAEPELPKGQEDGRPFLGKPGNRFSFHRRYEEPEYGVNWK